MKKNISIALCLWALLFACQRQSPAQYPPYCYDRARYEGLMLACTPKSKTRAESEQCKQKLDAECGFVETVSKNAHE